MSVTLKQIADMAGVHKSTVDKVIHDRPGVSEAKREPDPRPARAIRLRVQPARKGAQLPEKEADRRHSAGAHSSFRRAAARHRARAAGFRELQHRARPARDRGRRHRAAGRLSAGIPRERSGRRHRLHGECEAVKTALCALHDADIPLILVHSAPKNMPYLVPHRAGCAAGRPHGGANARASARRQRQGRRTAHPGRRHAAGAVARGRAR